MRQLLSTLYSFIKRKNANVRSLRRTKSVYILIFQRDIIMDDRDLSFSKSEDEQSEMSNHDYEQDIKPVIIYIFIQQSSFIMIIIISVSQPWLVIVIIDENIR